MLEAPEFPLSPVVSAFAALLAGMVALWLLSLRLRNVSIVDAFWGPAFVLLCGALAAVHATWTPRALLVLALVAVWGGRLGLHLGLRAHGAPEDRRYAAMRAKRGAAFAWQSLYSVFGLQAVLAFIIAMPMQLAILAPASPLGWWDAVGALVWLVGLGFEAGADLQLTRFRGDPGNRGRVLDTGLFRYSRHPNYFGDACVFWGFGIIGVAVPGGAWGLVGPALLTLMLLRVSGVAMLERDIAERRPEYRRYVRTTSAFVPWFPRRAEPGASGLEQGE